MKIVNSYGDELEFKDGKLIVSDAAWEVTFIIMSDYSKKQIQDHIEALQQWNNSRSDGND